MEATAAAQLQDYWEEIVPEGRPYDETKAVNLVVGMVLRYEKALCAIAENGGPAAKVAMEALGFFSLDQVRRMKEARP